MTILGFITLIGQLFWFYLPTGVANMSPVVFHNRLQFLAKPVDGGMKLAGKPVFGDHKTWRGLFVATLFGGLFFFGAIWAYTVAAIFFAMGTVRYYAGAMVVWICVFSGCYYWGFN